METPERTFNFNIVQDPNGYSYYEIPANTLLYRGDTALYPHFQKPNVPAFFSTEPKFVKHYGILFRFITTAPIKLLVLDNHADYTKFYDSVPEDKQTILRRQFGYESGRRDSAYVSDMNLVKHLCSIGMEGFANDRMRVDDFAVVDPYEGEEDIDDRLFHPELALCDLSKIDLVNPQEDVENYIKTYGQEAFEKEVRRKEESIKKWEEKNKREQARRGDGNKRRNMGIPINGALFDSPEKGVDLFSRMDSLTGSDNDTGTSSDLNSLTLPGMTSSSSSNNLTDDSFSSPPSSPNPSIPSNPSTPGSPPRFSIIKGTSLFESPPKKQRRGGKKSMKKKKQHNKKTHKKKHKKKTTHKKHARKGRKKTKAKRRTKKRGGVSRSLANRPPTPPMSLPGTPVMDATMDNLQRYWIRPELYPTYINQAFAVIGDIDRIEALYREGELRYFFRTLIIDRFRQAIEYDRSNWELIVNNIRNAHTGRIVGQLRERNAMMSQIYQENMVIIGRMNPDSPHSNSTITVRV
jgi:hypothetical protein